MAEEFARVRATRWGVIVVLLMVFGGFVAILSAAFPLIIPPAWWGMSYLVYRRMLSPKRQPAVNVLAVHTGQLAWMIKETFYWDASLFASVGPVLAVTLTLVVWFYLRPDRLAAGALVVLQLALAGKSLLEWPTLEINDPMLRLTATVMLMHVCALTTLGLFFWRRGQVARTPPTPIEVFD